MMRTGKKSFLVYFDHCRLLQRLTLEQTGQVMLLLAEYAERDCTDREPEAFLEAEIQKLAPDAAMMLRIMTDAARRDEIKYRAGERNRREGASGGAYWTDKQDSALPADDLARRNADVQQWV